jgi:release factor glutamine methyltransferase
MATANLNPPMTIFQAHRTIFHLLVEKTGDREEARATARRLMDELTATPHAHLTQPDRVLPPYAQARFQSALTALKNNRPLPYILGEQEFYQLTFRCDERALIPRPETELLVQTALEKFRSQISNRGTFRIADLGTGSGCVAIAIAFHSPDAQIIATDVSPGALELARENACRHHLAERILFVPGKEGDWASPLREYSRPEGGGFDVIVSNPPYIAPRDIENLPLQIKDFEPRRALDGGEDGLDCYRQIAAQCKPLLKPNGTLACELGAGQFAGVRAIFENENWRVQKPIRDFAGIERVLVAQPRTSIQA